MRKWQPEGKYLVHFEVLRGHKTKSGALIPISYTFWEPLLSYFINRCTDFRIECWMDEKAAIARAVAFGMDCNINIDNMKAFTGNVTEEFIFELMHNPFDEEGKIKWFSIFLMDADEYVISAEHYGSEFAVYCLNQEDVEYIRSILSKDFIFHV